MLRDSLLDDSLRYGGDAFVTTSEDLSEHLLEFRHEAISKCSSDHILRTPRLCLYKIQHHLIIRHYPHNGLAKRSPTEAEGRAIPFLTFD